jgi:hypothetical protein
MRLDDYSAIFLVFVISNITGTDGLAIYQKYLHRTLTNASSYAALGIQKVFECEIICSEHGLKCKGANFYNHGPRDYVCELLGEVPAVIDDGHLRYTKDSKLIVKRGMSATYTNKRIVKIVC